VLHIVDADDYTVLLRSEVDPIHECVLIEAGIVRRGHGSLDAQSLVKAVSEIGKLLRIG